MQVDIEDVLAILTRELDLDEGDITAESTSTDVEFWDSLGHLRVCMALEERYGSDPDGRRCRAAVRSRDRQSPRRLVNMSPSYRYSASGLSHPLMRYPRPGAAPRPDGTDRSPPR